MKAFKVYMPYEAELALKILSDNGYDGYIVGGCVRDSILGVEPEDWDITTSALPSQITECFKDYKMIETGLKHGTVAVIINNVMLEITTYRIDGKYTDNRRPDFVEFTNKIELDLERRDFTINAMAYNEAIGLVDCFCGIDDINLKKIKCVGNPDIRFSEDGLRILRALRFASVLDFQIEDETSKSIHKNREMLKNISAERLAAEFNKLIKGVNFMNIMTEYRDVISVFIPELKNMSIYENGRDLYHHSLIAMANVRNDLVLKLVLLFHETGRFADPYEIKKGDGYSKTSLEIASNALNRLKYDKSTIKSVKNLIMHHDEKIEANAISIKRWLNKIGEESLKNLIEIKKADLKSSDFVHEDMLREIFNAELIMNDILKNNHCYSLKNLAVKGDDLIAAGIQESSEIGRILNELLEVVIDEKIENNRDKLLNYAEKNINF